MTITFILSSLFKLGLTADEFTILMLLQENNLLTLKKYDKLIAGKLYEHLTKLKDLEYVDFKDTGTFPLENIELTDKFLEFISGDDLFEQFYNLYPVVAIRPDGRKDFLRSQKAKCKIKYTKIVRNNKLIHDHILDCLKYEKDLKKKTGTTSYQMRLSNWLEKKEWKKYEIYLKATVLKDEDSLINTNKTSYGAKFL